MGRLTLYVLLSFAQFDREVADERIRDKIAASKKKGMWMGGLSPLGYDVRDRKLVVNKEEARHWSSIYFGVTSSSDRCAPKAELDAAGIRSKHRTFVDGTGYGGHKLSRGRPNREIFESNRECFLNIRDRTRLSLDVRNRQDNGHSKATPRVRF